jgi:hypothetical protein
MAMTILQGTTPVLTIPFEGTNLDVSNFDAAELTLKSRTKVVTKTLAQMSADTENNKLSYHFTEAETLAFPYDTALTWQLFVRVGSERYGTKEAQFSIERKTKGAAMDG